MQSSPPYPLQQDADSVPRLLRRTKQLLAVQRLIRQALDEPPSRQEMQSRLSREAATYADGSNASSRACDFRSVLRLADNTSATLFAPQAWCPPPPIHSSSSAEVSSWAWQPPGRLVGGFPPAPQPENMQKGRLGLLNTQTIQAIPSATPVNITHAPASTSTEQGSERMKTYDHLPPPPPTLEKATTAEEGLSNIRSPGRSQKRPRSPSSSSVETLSNNQLVGGQKQAHPPEQTSQPTQRPLPDTKPPSLQPPIVHQPQQPATNKKSRAVSINFGFETDSDDDDSDEN